MQASNSCSHSLVCQSVQRSSYKSEESTEVLLSFAVSPQGERNMLDLGREGGTSNISHSQLLDLHELFFFFLNSGTVVHYKTV